MSIRPEVNWVRQALETALTPARVSSILFRALDRGGGSVPQTREELLGVVRGPLSQVLLEELGESEAKELAARVEAVLIDPAQLADYPSVTVVEEDVPDDSEAIEIRADLDDTASMPLSESAVPVFVVAASDRLASTLSATLGAARVAVAAISDSARLSRVADQGLTGVLLVDGGDLSTVEPSEIAAAASALPAGSAVIVWGAELPYGRLVAAALNAAGARPLALKRSDGAEPLLDLIRSRQGPAR